MINWISNTFISIEKRFPATPYIYALVANAAIATMQCATKLLGTTMPTNYILYIRATILVIFQTFVIRAAGGTVYVKKTESIFHVI